MAELLYTWQRKACVFLLLRMRHRCPDSDAHTIKWRRTLSDRESRSFRSTWPQSGGLAGEDISLEPSADISWVEIRPFDCSELGVHVVRRHREALLSTTVRRVSPKNCYQW